MRAIVRILLLWRGRRMWLASGVVVSLAALACGVALLGASGDAVARALLGLGVTAALALRVLGPARVVLRYAERLVTHAATFRALADLRVWFFSGVARGGAGGLGFARSADVLARLVGDVEALDGLYLRILVPLAGALLLLPVLVILAWPLGAGLAAILGGLFVLCAFLLPLLGARMAHDRGGRLAAARGDLRVAATDALNGLREVRAFGAQGRVLAQVQAREAAMLGAARGLARDVAASGAAALLCGQLALLAVLDVALFPGAAAHHRIGLVVLAFVTVAAFEAAAGLPRAGVQAGHAAAAAARVLEAATVAPAVADPPHPRPMPGGSGLRFEGVRFAWRPDRPPVFDGLTLEVPDGCRVALIGPSGCGKSTLAALALKVAAPQAGRVTLGGADLATLAAVGCAPAHRLAESGDAFVRRFDPRQSAARPARRGRCGAMGGAGRRAHRQFRAWPARWAGYLAWRSGRAGFRGTGKAAGAGAGAALAGTAAAAGRAVRGAGQRDRTRFLPDTERGGRRADHRADRASSDRGGAPGPHLPPGGPPGCRGGGVGRPASLRVPGPEPLNASAAPAGNSAGRRS